MIVAISTNGNNLESDVDSRFGRCSAFLLYETEKDIFKIIPNKGQFEGHGAGITSAQTLVDEGVQVVISGNIGPNAFSVLQSAKIEMYTYIGKIREALTLLQQNRLPSLDSPRKGPMVGMGRGGFKD